MVPTYSYEISRVSHYSRYCLLNLSYSTGLSPSLVRLPRRFFFNRLIDYTVLNPKIASNLGLGSSYFARHYSRNRVFFIFLQVLRCFSSLRSPPIHYFTYVWITRFFFLAEFPHSDICGSRDICSLPQLFAACHVLLRLLVPRYPPYALCSLTSDLISLSISCLFNSFGLIVCILLSYASLPNFSSIYIFFNVLIYLLIYKQL